MISSRRLAGLGPLPALAAGFVVLVCIAILMLSGWRELTLRHAALRNAEVDVTNVAQSVVQQADDSFDLVDTVVVGLVNQLETEGSSPDAIVRLQTAIDRRKPTLGRVRGVFVYDSTGRWLATSENVDLAAFNNSDRDYFKRHRASSSKDVLIGNPVKSRSGGQWIITVSRRFNHPDGTFAGVVLGTIDASYFSRFYKRFDLGPSGTITLLSKDGIVMARSVDEDANVGRDVSSTPLIKDLNARPPQSVYYFKSTLDGTWRLSFYKLSDRYPILVVATEAKDDALAAWRSDALTRLGIFLALLALIGAIGTYLVRQLLKGQRMAAALRATEADYRLLAEESSDMVARIGFDGKLLYVSPSCRRILGWTAEQLTGTPALAGVNAVDLPRVEQLVTALRQGEVEDAKVIYRTRHLEKGEIWLESALHATRNPDTGRIDGVVAISRDMTEHKDLQDKLGVLATQDGLTGLANRRHFDERLGDAWLHAKLEDRPLSLLMVDVDHFKKFNDRYGHQAGDACLRSFANLLASEARETDLVAARYGGEEFVVLLPDTDEAGCEAVAERIRLAAQALRIPHASNHPSRIVTVSVGGATGRPTADGSSVPASLLATADRALYAAKRGGRNRVVMAGQVIDWPGAESA